VRCVANTGLRGFFAGPLVVRQSDYRGPIRGPQPDNVWYSAGQPWSATWSLTSRLPWSSTGLHVVLNRTTVVRYVILCRTTVVRYVVLNRTSLVINRTARGRQPDNAWSSAGQPWSATWSFTGLQWSSTWSSAGLLWSSTWSSTGQLWSSTWSFAGVRVVIYRIPWSSTWSSAGQRVVICRTTVVFYVVLCRTSVVLCMIVWRLRGHHLDCFCPTYLERSSVTETFEIADLCEL